MVAAGSAEKVASTRRRILSVLGIWLAARGAFAFAAIGVEPASAAASPETLTFALAVATATLGGVVIWLVAAFRGVRASERRVRGLVESAPDAMIIVDGRGRIVLVNAQAEALFGYERSELIGESVEKLVPESARARHPDLRTGYTTSPRVRPMGAGLDLSGRRKDGSEIPVEISLSPLRTEDGVMSCAVVRDVTERRRQENAVREARALAESIVETIGEPLVVLDAELRVQAANGAFHRRFELGSEPVRGRSFFAIDAGGWTSPELRVRLASVAAGGAELRDLEIEDVHNATGVRTLHVSARPIRRPETVAPQILVAITDVTERKRAMQYLAEREALERTNRELQDFAYVASHDLQEPLRKIQAFGDRLATSYGAMLPAEASDFVTRMQTAAARMGRLIDDLLAFSRVTTRAQTFARIDLATVVREVVNDLEIRIEQTGGRVDVAPLPVIDGDASQLRQLFQNLIANALKFHRPDVPPHVMVRASEVVAAVPGAPTRPRRSCRIEVQDNGIGFEEKYLDRIFTIFQRLHGRGTFEGTGLGLAICRKIVERHRGEITARSVVGEGSTFVVTLPLQQADLRREVG